MSGYVQYGPFSNSNAPYISQAFLNPLETFLLSINSAAYDANITSDGSGNVTAIGTIKFLASKAKLMINNGSAFVDASGGTDLLLNAPNTGGGHKIKLQVGGVSVLSSDSTGNFQMLGALTQNGTP